MRKILGFIALLTVCLAPSNANSADNHSVYLGAGVFFQNMMKVTSSSDASKSTLGQLYIPALSLAYSTTLFSTHFMPILAYTPLAKTESDSVKKHVLLFGLPLIFSNGAIDFKAGPGLMLYSVGGSGGTEDLSNGASTATFYLPGTSHTSKSIYLDLGVGYSYSDACRIDADILIPGMMGSRRSLNLIVQISRGIF